MYSQRELKKPEDPDMVCFMDETGEVAIYAAHARIQQAGAQEMSLVTLIERHRIDLTKLTAHLAVGRCTQELPTGQPQKHETAGNRDGACHEK